MLEKIKKFLIETFGSYKIFKIEKIVPAGTEQASNLKILYTELSDHFFHVSRGFIYRRVHDDTKDSKKNRQGLLPSK